MYHTCKDNNYAANENESFGKFSYGITHNTTMGNENTKNKILEEYHEV